MATHGRPVVLIGFSGSGKTQVGKSLHRQFGFQWSDIDSSVEEKAGRSIAEIIRVEGEAAFRAQEAQMLAQALESQVDVISVGGGALIDEGSRSRLARDAVLVFLSASESVLAMRVDQDERRERKSKLEALRPLLYSSEKKKKERASTRRERLVERVRQLLAVRQGLYELAPLKIWTDWLEVEAIASLVAEEVELRRKGFIEKITILPSRAGSNGIGQGRAELSEIVIGSGIYRQLVYRLKAKFPAVDKVALLIDENVYECWGEQVVSLLQEGRLESELIVIPSGEESKNLPLVGEVSERLLAKGLGRNDVVIAFGGGVVGDLGGLIASLYMRGVGLVHLPTTLVAQVDSAIGGKTAVNLQGGKNILGTFYPGALVLSDVDFLSTLPERERKAGLAEVIKYGLIHSQVFFEWLEENLEHVLAGEASAIQKVVEFCAKTKLEFVIDDLHDVTGKRALLNFGHTIGHVLEKLTGFGDYLHGEAVAIGMVQALVIGEKLGKTETGLAERTKRLLERASLPVTVPRFLLEGAWEFQKLSLSHGQEWVDGKIDSFVEASVQKASIYSSEVAERFVQRWIVALKADKKRVSKQINFVIVGKLGQAKSTLLRLVTLVSFLAEMRVNDEIGANDY